MTSLAAPLLSAQAPVRRSFERGEWREYATIADPKGTFLRKPQLVAASNEQIYVIDYDGPVLRAIDFKGNVLWESNGASSGSRPFENPSDLKVTSDGGAVVLDPQLRRATRFDKHGTIGSVLALTANFRAMSADVRQRSLAIPLSGALAVDLDAHGSAMQGVSAPALLKGVPELAREPLLADADSSECVIAFRWSTSVFVVSRDLRQIRTFEQLAPVPFPRLVTAKRGEYLVSRVDPRAKEVVVALGATSSEVLILRNGREEQFPVLDRYSKASGRYIGSRRLPARAVRFATTGNHMVALVTSPAPALYVWQWVPHRPLATAER